MNKGERYDQMTFHPDNDPLKCFENYSLNMEFIQAKLLSYKPERILDLGCGTGNLTGHLSKRVEVIGLDQSPEMLQQLKKKYPEMTCIQADGIKWLEAFKFKENDILASSFVLHGIKQKEKLYKLFLNALQEGARIILMDYCFESQALKDNFVQTLIEEHRMDLFAFINSKHYLYINKFKEWCDHHNIKIEIHKHTHWIYSMDLSL
ncbi:class I SAM-dependent methyltransferase [Fusibacter sp. JL216-2]|uniref:class I SAM-dependent methyltransferase n=1 Tax=Fusibacter sp. JL216-2 TaxID=3071453 RepID=UPI003D32C8D9